MINIWTRNNDKPSSSRITTSTSGLQRPTLLSPSLNATNSICYANALCARIYSLEDVPRPLCKINVIA